MAIQRLTVLLIAFGLTIASCSGNSDAPPEVSPSDSADTTVAAQLSDAETVWCGSVNNSFAVASAAMSLKVDGYEEVEAIYTEHSGSFGIGIDDPVRALIGTDVMLHWKPSHEEAWARACKAAFEAR